MVGQLRLSLTILVFHSALPLHDNNRRALNMTRPSEPVTAQNQKGRVIFVKKKTGSSA
jgi:hypothetical protein